ncbi:MAG: hypothetical protein WDM78_20965 [Puia sp.]
MADINHDGHPDLVIANGGNEFYGKDEQLRPRIYLNDGKEYSRAIQRHLKISM